MFYKMFRIFQVILNTDIYLVIIKPYQNKLVLLFVKDLWLKCNRHAVMIILLQVYYTIAFFTISIMIYFVKKITLNQLLLLENKQNIFKDKMVFNMSTKEMITKFKLDFA